MQHFKLTLTLQSFFLSVFLLLLTHPFYVLAEGTKSIAPSTADEAALFVGAGNTGTRGGDYGLFAWKDSDSKLYFNIQNRCEKVYMGFSIPKNDRSFADLNPVYGGSGIEENLIFRIVDPLGNPINNLSCFGNTTINGEVWQTLNSSTANISNRATADNGPSQLGNAAGYNGFELDLSACGLNLTGNYSIEFYTTNANYNPNTARSGFYIPYFDITVANCTNQGMTGRVWSNNWGIGIKRDGQGSFDRAFNGKLYVCSAEGFITKIDFNTNTNTRAAAGRQTDQRSGFRAGSFNISFNQQGTGATGDVIADRQSLPNVNAPNPELPVFLNLPDEAFCPVRELGDIKAAAEFITGCPQNRCINVAATQPGQFEIVIEGPNGNGILDQPSERRVIYQITEANKVTNPETAGYIYEACIPWDGKDGNGNILLEVAITITGKYFQGIYHFPVYDAEFNDDGFIVETVRPALGRQLLYYDDTKITEVSSSTESKDGTNGCIGPCHRWTGEWENYADKDDNYGNYNTINTWWFASTSSQDFTSNVGGLSPIGITCPADFVGCTSQSTDPSVTGQASTIPNNINCEFVLDYTDVVVTDNCDKKVIERNWFAYLKDLPNNRKTCTQTITLNAPILTNCPSDVVLACADGNTYSWNPPTIAGTCGGTIRQTNGPVSGSVFPTGTTTIRYQIEGTCGTAQTCSFTITVNDKGDANDLSISCPADVTGCAGQSTDPSITGTATVSVTNSTCPTTLNYTDVVTDNGCGAKTIKREWIVYFTNKPNERKACTQTITLAAPTLSNCPTDVVLGCTDGNIYSWNAPTVSGTCGGTITQISGPASGSAFPIGTTTVAYQIGTGCANQICSFTVTVNDAGDVNDLSIICPADITRCAGQSTAPSAIGAATVTVSNSNCPTTLIHNDVVTDNGCGAKTIQREWVVYFTHKPTERTTCTQTISITAPTLSDCPADVVLGCADGNIYSWNAPTVNGTCSGTVIQTSGPASGSAFPVGTTTITYQVGEGCANQTCSFTVTVKDAGDPDDLTIICPTVPADATGCIGQSSDPSITGTPNIVNNSSCPTTLDYTDIVTDNGCGAKTITREWVVYFTNNPSIRKTCIQKITLTAPTLSNCPTDVVLNCNDGNTYSWNPPTANGNCGGPVTQTSGPASGSAFPVGTTTITYQVGGGCANQTCSFTVTVKDAGNLDDLTIICPSIPADATGCTSSDPSITGTATVINNSSCPTTLEYTDAVTDDGCGAKTIKREWVVYFTNNPAIRKTCSQVIIITAPTLGSCPADVVLGCEDGNTYSWNAPTINGTCSGTVIRTSGPASGSAFPVGTTTITYQIGDGCANQTCSFTVTVTGAGTPDDLTIICPSIPADVADCTGQSSDPTITGTPTVVNNSSCPTTLEYTDAVTDDGCGAKTIKREWVVYFTNNPAIRKTCSQVIIITAPTLINCPTDVVLNCGDGNTYSWIPPSVPGNCGGPVTQTSGPASGSAFPVGTTTITYQIGDGCANQTCSFTVTVNGAGDANDLTITCPADVTGCAGQSITPGVTGTATVTVANSNCPTTLGYNDVVTNNGCGAKTIKREWVVYFTNNSAIRKTCTQTITLAAPTLSNCPTDVVLSCEDGNTHSWNAPTVNGNCGGTLTQTSGPASGSSFPIGTTTITYQIGDGCTNQICSFTVTVVDGGGLTTNCPADVVLDCVPEQNGAIYSWETPTASSCCNSCPEPGIDLTDFVYMGILNGHQYYCSKEKADWATAKATCESQGGHLAVINSAEENQMLSAFLKDQSAYIGLSDIQQEGVFEWCNNDPVTYSNWYPGQPDNYGNNQDVTRLFPNGVWDDIAGHYKLEYILEIPCLSIQQCAGPESGSVFPVGTTEVAYHIEDNCGNEEVCTFNVTVNPCDNLVDYCDITGQNTTYFWIRHVVLGAINNPTVANGGYGDFSNLSTNVQAGSEQTIILSPGFARNKYYLNWRVWIDYNRDGDFNDANEELFTIRDYNILKIKFRVPQQCAIGQTRMRVSMKYGNPANHCQDFTYGEVEDYTINLTPATNGLSAITGTSRSTNEVEVEVIPHESTAPLSNLLPTETPSLTVFPNPVATNLQVQLTDYQQLDGVLKIYNHLGQTVHQELLSRDNKQQVSIAVNHLPDGMYLLSVESDDAAPIVRKFNKH